MIFRRILPLRSGYYPDINADTFKRIWPWVFPNRYSVYTIPNMCITLSSDKYSHIAKKAYENMECSTFMIFNIMQED